MTSQQMAFFKAAIEYPRSTEYATIITKAIIERRPWTGRWALWGRNYVTGQITRQLWVFDTFEDAIAAVPLFFAEVNRTEMFARIGMKTAALLSGSADWDGAADFLDAIAGFIAEERDLPAGTECWRDIAYQFGVEFWRPTEWEDDDADHA